MAKRKRTAPGDKTTPAADDQAKVLGLMSKIAESLAPGEPVQFHVTGNSQTTGYYMIPSPPEEAPPAGSAATGGEQAKSSIAQYEECPYCLFAMSHTLAQHTAAIMRQPGPRPQR
jgi:hypothetical protein